MSEFKFERISTIRIPKQYHGHSFYNDIKNHLTRRSKDYNSETYTTNTFYVESEKFLHIPRYFPIHDFMSCKIENAQHIGEDIEIESNIVPRNKLQENAIDHMLKNENSLIELQPGVGKTVISIKVISELKKKTIILTHRDSLVQQWKDRVCEFTNMTQDDVAVLRSKSFIEDLKKPIIIATVQTFLSLVKRKYAEFIKALYEANIGIMIADEVHTSVGAPTFSECSMYIPALRVYGLSATPYRADGNSDIINYHLGPTFSDIDVDGTMAARVTVVLFDYGIDLPSKKRYFYWEGSFQKSRYLNGMTKSIPFIALSKSILSKMYLEDRHIIYVAERIKVLDEIMEWDKIPSENKTKFIAGVGNEVLSTQLVFSTPGKIRDGVDCAWKDALVMTSPISNISQIAGRVIRSSEGKKEPIIIDMVDIGCSPIRRSLHRRLEFYDAKGWEVQFLYIDVNKDYEKSFISRNDVLKKM